MLFLAIIILLTSLAIAGVAAYFSVIGLSMLFVGSGISIIVMGTALEVGKLITVTVLKQMWQDLSLLLKTYLLLASIALSAITSVGIYGYLSNGYNATSIKINSLTENKTVLENRITVLKDTNKKLEEAKVSTKRVDDSQKNRNDFATQQLQIISQKELRIKELLLTIEKENQNSLNQQSNAKTILDDQVTKELNQIPTFNSRLSILDKEVQTWLDQGTGGLFKQNGLEKARLVKESQKTEREAIDKEIKSIQNNVETLRQSYNKKIADIEAKLNEKITNYNASIKAIEKEIENAKIAITENQKQNDLFLESENTKAEDVVEENKKQIKINDDEIIKLNDKIKEISTQINNTDVGTFKFISKNFNLELDKTVSWFILSIILVFDPLAVTLLLCFNQIIKSRKRKPGAITPPADMQQQNIILPTPSLTPSLSSLDDDWFEHTLPNLKREFKDFPQK
jgi:hypothetical protein